MKTGICVSLILMLAFSLWISPGCTPAGVASPPTTSSPMSTPPSPEAIKLPPPRLESAVSFEGALLARRSVREYTDAPLTLSEVSQLMWAAQGITSASGFRTAPSAGGTYPLEVYLVVGNVDRLPPGVYRYLPPGHELVKIREGDVRAELTAAALDQSPVREAAVDIVITAIYARTTGKYGERGIRYVHLEAGHAAQNLCLEAVALDLGAVTIGAFFDDRVRDILGASTEEEPLYVIPVGKR